MKTQKRTVKFRAMWVADLNVQYSLARYLNDDVDYDAVIEKCVGRSSDGSGGGFGGRDLHWCFMSLTDAERAATRLKKLKIKGLKLKVSTYAIPEEEQCETSFYFTATLNNGKVTIRPS